MARRPAGDGQPAAELHPQQQRVPAPRAGPAAARLGPADAAHRRWPAGRSSWSADRQRAADAAQSLQAVPARAAPRPRRRGRGRRRPARRRPQPHVVVVSPRARTCPSAKVAPAPPSDVVVVVEPGGGPRRPSNGSSGSARARTGSRPPPPPRTPPCCWPTPPTPRVIVGGRLASDPRGVPRPRPRRVSPAPTSPGSRSAPARRRRRPSRCSTPGGCARATCSWSCWSAWSRVAAAIGDHPGRPRVGAVDLQAWLGDVVDRASGDGSRDPFRLHSSRSSRS